MGNTRPDPDSAKRLTRLSSSLTTIWFTLLKPTAQSGSHGTDTLSCSSSSLSAKIGIPIKSTNPIGYGLLLKIVTPLIISVRAVSLTLARKYVSKFWPCNHESNT